MHNSRRVVAQQRILSLPVPQRTRPNNELTSTVVPPARVGIEFVSFIAFQARGKA